MHGVPFWVVATLVTAAIWVAAFTLARRQPEDIPGSMVAWFIVFVAVFATLVVWLVYFIIV